MLYDFKTEDRSLLKEERGLIGYHIYRKKGAKDSILKRKLFKITKPRRSLTSSATQPLSQAADGAEAGCAPMRRLR